MPFRPRIGTKSNIPDEISLACVPILGRFRPKTGRFPDKSGNARFPRNDMRLRSEAKLRTRAKVEMQVRAELEMEIRTNPQRVATDGAFVGAAVPIGTFP